MLKISKVLLLLVLIAASFAGAMEKLWLSCAIGASGEDICYIHQQPDEPDTLPSNYECQGPFEWNQLVDAFKATRNVVDNSVILGSDIVFDGYDATKNECVNKDVVSFPLAENIAIAMPSYYVNSFNGQDYTIKNFCMVGEQKASFFEGTTSNPVTIQNVVFDGAYVELNPQKNGGPFYGGVVVDKLNGSTSSAIVKNLTVKNSKLQIVSQSGVEGAHYVGTIAGSAENADLEGNTVENVIISGDNQNGEGDANTYDVGGLVGNVEATGNGNGYKVEANDVSVQIELPFKKTTCVGGLVGDLDVKQSVAFTASSNRVRPSNTINAENADDQSVINLTATEMDLAYVGGVLGRYTAHFGDVFIRFNSVYGKISVEAEKFNQGYSWEESGIGGILGNANEIGSSVFEVYSNSSIGSIKVHDDVADGSFMGNVGFVAGVVNSDMSNLKMNANYHYGKDDYNIARSVFSLGADADVASEITSVFSGFEHNYRNAIYSNGSAILAESGVITDIEVGYAVDEENNRYPNPIIHEDSMKARSFAYILNKYGTYTWDAGGNIVTYGSFWENDDANAGLPYLTDRQTVYRIVVTTADFIDASKQNTLYEKLDLLKPYYMGEYSNAYHILTDRNGKIPNDFVSAYEHDLKDKYGLLYNGKSATLSMNKIYSLNSANFSNPEIHAYDVKETALYKVVYENGIGGTLDFSTVAYAPARFDSFDKFDNTKIAPRIFDVNDGYKEYNAVQGYVSCTMEGTAAKSNDVPLYDNHWDVAEVIFKATFGGAPAVTGESSCTDDRVLHLVYQEAGTATARPIIEVVNSDTLKPSVVLYGYDVDGNEVEVSESLEIFSGHKPYLASQMKLSIDFPGYAVKSLKLDLTTFGASKECFDHPELKKCFFIEDAPSYLGTIESISNDLEQHPYVVWTVSLDESKVVVLDSLLAAIGQSERVASDYYYVARLRADTEIEKYTVTFELPENETFYSDRDIVKTADFYVKNMVSFNEMPTGVYSNDYCVVGWTTQNYGTDAPASWKEVITSYDPNIFDNLLEPGEVTLYPVLMPAELCAVEKDLPQEWVGATQTYYARMVVENTVGANIGITEVTALGDTVAHKFGQSGQVLLSRYGKSRWYLDFEAKDGFEAPDSMVLSYDASRRGNEFDGPYKIGPGKLIEDSWLGFGMLLSGEFKMTNQTELAFAESSFAQSGSLVQVKWETSKFAVGRDAKLNVYMADALGNVDTVMSVLVDKTPYVDSLLLRGRSGAHVFLVELRDVLDSNDSFERTFYVNSEIADAGKDIWQMVSLNAVNMKNVGKDDDQIFYRWDDTAEIGEFWHYLRFLPGNDVVSAGGYWYSSLEGRTLKIDESFADSIYDFEWNLENVYSGWNMVGNPHNWNVKVPDDLEIVMWDPATGDYAPNRGYLKPFEAAWVRVEKNRKVSVNGDPYFVPDSLADAAAAKKRALVKTKNAENWTIRAILADNKGKMDSWNILGMGDAQEGFEPPAGMGDIVSFAVKDGKKYLAKSVKAAPASSADSAALEWDVLLSASSDRKGKLYFEGLEGIEAYGYHLYVTVDGRTSELTAGDTLAVALKAASTTAKVRVSKEKLYFRTAVEGLRMVQAGNKLNVGFTATENLDGSRMVVDILDMDGKVVSTYSARAVAGSNAVSLDAPKSGLYMLRVRVASQQAAGKILVK